MPATRYGRTHKVMVGPCSVYVTANTDATGALGELLAKADEGNQGVADGLCDLASLAIQHGAAPATVARHLRHHRYPPEGFAGQPKSISDAIGLVIERELRAVATNDKAKGETAE